MYMEGKERLLFLGDVDVDVDDDDDDDDNNNSSNNSNNNNNKNRPLDMREIYVVERE